MFFFLPLLDSCLCFFFFFKQKTAYEMSIGDWSSDVCSSDLLVVRLHALIRRGQYDAEPIGEGLAMNPAAHAVSVEGRTVTLTPTEYRLLAKLAARRGEVVRRRELTLAAWPDGAIVHDNTLDAYVARIRRKLRELGH